MEDMIPYIPSLLFLFGEVRIRVPVPGRWMENISIEESKPAYILSLWLVMVWKREIEMAAMVRTCPLSS